MEFVLAVEKKFGKDDYRQTGSVEEYFTAFQSLQFQVGMHNSGYGELFFASQFVNGLKEEIRYPVQAQVPDDVDRAFLLAKIQQKIMDRSKSKLQKMGLSVKTGNTTTRGDYKSTQPSSNLRERKTTQRL